VTTLQLGFEHCATNCDVPHGNAAHIYQYMLLCYDNGDTLKLKQLNGTHNTCDQALASLENWHFQSFLQAT
jgi:hypothetical protein